MSPRLTDLFVGSIVLFYHGACEREREREGMGRSCLGAGVYSAIVVR